MDQVEVVVESAFLAFYEAWRAPIHIIAILALAMGVTWLLRRLLMRAVNRIVRGVKKSQDVENTAEIQTTAYVNARAVQRTRTLGTVGRAVISVTVWTVALILILNQAGINFAALLTSAGVVAAGLAFGAQNIVKDILNGIFMVFEDQLGVGDVITVGDINGTVEDVGIRVTQVRAADGMLWFIRNGEILTLGNSSQGWGRALIDVTVDAKQDLQRVSEVTLDAAKALLHSDRYARKVIGEPEILGLESVFGDRATLRLAVRTRPEAQWEVQRGIRAELRRKYLEAGIKMSDEHPRSFGGTA